MKTFNFLYKYVQDKALVTISLENGDILYTGELGEMPHKIIRNTTLVKVNGLGSENDLIIIIRKD